MTPIGGGEPPVAFGDVRRDREGRAAELVYEEAVAVLETLGLGADVIGEVESPCDC
jgi:hypothetical protein